MWWFSSEEAPCDIEIHGDALKRMGDPYVASAKESRRSESRSYPASARRQHAIVELDGAADVGPLCGVRSWKEATLEPRQNEVAELAIGER